MLNTDKENVELAKQEYDQYQVGDTVTIGKGDSKKTIGYVSEIVNNKETGEQAFIITDGNPKLQKPDEVNHVTILFQGSLGIDKTVENPGEVKRDWWDNNKQIAKTVVKGLKDPKAEFEPTKQMKSSGKTLNNAMDKYFNATFDAYGHSQASSNVQYALGALDSQGKIDRISGAFIYQGPNAFSMLNKKQRKRVAQLKDRIFNFVDEKDAVPIGYRISNGILNSFHIGTIIFVDSKKKGMTDQHMWGGYQFKNGQLQVTKESLVQFQQAKHTYNMLIMREQVKALEQLEKKLTASGGGLSSGERIYLEDSRALAVVSHASSEFETAMLLVVMVYQKGIQNAEKLWTETLTDARSIGVELSESEIISALASGGCTKQSIVTEPVNEYQQKITKAKKMYEKFNQLAKEIRGKVTELVQRDQELAKQLKGLVS
ncbi:hypothetical protein [Candidatus Enterococcus mansonii]|uniref:Uncharacterized protein n=1 Tax=Candidatus Enterococcus mansonii TaxID=1834181 RepID=A0A242C665_9ENTE|nr:hypothetical protein [Enterococcus sp. 4G2_DIV0659]OTO05681.1 hypothetical protein A5880_002856 [Enterococcus sp. 4G2_DIV0659]